MATPTSDCNCPDCPPWLPPAGPTTGRCRYCHSQDLALVHHREYRDPPSQGWPDTKHARRADTCRTCGGDLIEGHRLSAVPGALAGAHPKVSARSEPWTVCTSCQVSTPVIRWAWMICHGCGHESRGRI